MGHSWSFYDVPRTITFSYRDRMFFLLSDFDDNLDDYSTSYAVYLIPKIAEDSARAGSWEFMKSATITRIGNIQIDLVTFDPSKRKELDASFIDSFINSWTAEM